MKSVASTKPALLDFLSGGDDMGARIRAFDWSQTAIGAPDTWSPTLRMMVRFLLANRFPMLLWWGPQYVQIYNDPYRPIPGAKHPGSLGQSASECWSEIWDVIGPLVDTPFRNGPATWIEDLELEIRRRDFTEETHFTVAYSAVPDDTAPGGIGGVLATVHEITAKVIAERRVALLRDLGTRAAEAKTAEEACATGAATLAAHPKDVPFAMLYLIEPDGKSARLAAAGGIESASNEFYPPTIDLETATAPWPLGAVRASEQMQIVGNLSARFKNVPSGPWSDAPHTAVVLPIASNVARQPTGFLVAGVSARIAFDDGYKDFFQVAVGPIATAITNARAYEGERRRAEALAEIDRAKTTFFSNVSHEFRTPLTLMLGPLETLLAKNGSFQPEDQEQIETAHRNSLRLLKLVNTLLDFSRIEAGRFKATYRPVDLAASTADLAANFRSAIETAGLTFAVDCPPLPKPVYADPEMWEKIVLNLLSNAFKFTFTGGVTVRLRAENDKAVLTVSDTGTGIPAAELPHIFERFHRVEGAKGRSFEGTGIGLALIQELARMHGGEVTAESRSGEGSTFRVSLPFGKSHLPAERIGDSLAPHAALPLQAWLLEGVNRQADNSPPAERNAADKRARIVIADDNADMREHVSRILGETYILETVANGEEALALIRHDPPDLLITDIMMPGMDGFQLLRAVREDPSTRTLPVIFLSARAGEEARVEGIQTGADDYLVKPFTANELRARVGTHVGMAKARRRAIEHEAALRAEAEMARDEVTGVLESITDGYIALDKDWRLTHVNAEAERLNGMRREAMLGKNHWELFPAAVGTTVHQELLRAASERIPVDFENYYAPWDRWFHVKAYPAAEGGLSVFYEDITARKRGVTALSESEERLRLATENAEIGFWDVDAVNDILTWPPRVKAMFGISPDVPVSMLDFYNGLHPDDRAATSEAYAAAADPGRRALYDVEYRTVGKDDGRIRWVAAKGRGVFDEQGRCIRVVGTAIDISQRKATEAALLETETRFRELADNISQFAWVTDETGWIFWYNERWYDYTGTTLEEMQGWGWQKVHHPDHVERVVERFRKYIQRGEDWEDTFPLRGKHGEWRWFLSRAQPIRAGNGKIVRWFGTNTDITAQRDTEARLSESEARYRALAEQVADGIFIADPQGRYVDANGAAAEMLGYALDELLTLSIPDVLEAGELEKLPQQFERLATGETIQNDWRFRRKDGSQFIGDLVARQLPDGRLQGVVRDVTERRMIEDELRRANADLEQFAYSASHDLQEPIRNVAVYSEILETRYSAVLDRHAKEYLGFVTNGAKRMDALVKDLLAYTQCGTGTDEAAESDAEAVIKQAMENLATTITDTKAAVTHGRLPSVSLPPVQLQQLFQNLIGNAIKYRRDDVIPQVHITCERSGGHWTFAVKDNGIGIDPEHQEKVFGIFKRLHNEDKYAGTGIGLAICQKIVERRGGRIWVASSGEGQGSTFYFTLAVAGGTLR